MPLKVENLFFPPQCRDVCMYPGGLKNYQVIILAALIVLTTGCAERRLEDAFHGKFASTENNKVIKAGIGETF